MEEKTPYLDIKKLSDNDSIEIKKFSCGNKVLDDFFHEEIFLCSRHHHISAYCAKLNNEIVAIFTLSNDSVVIDNVDRDDFLSESSTAIHEEYISTFEKQTSFPAVNIGHLGVREDMQGKKIGEEIVYFVIYTFTKFEIAGCQFITVDSLNNPRTNKFYMGCGFINQTEKDIYSNTRRMYLPLKIY